MQRIQSTVSQIGHLLFVLLRAVIIFGLAFIILKPFFVKIMTAFMLPKDLLDATVRYIPKNWSFHYWKIGLLVLNLKDTVGFTLYTTLVNGFLQVIMSVTAGYGLARHKFPGRKFLYAMVIIIMLIPPQTYSIAQYLRFWKFGLIDNALSSFLLSATGLGLKQGLYIYLFMNFFRSLPRDIEYAARIDGAGAARIFFTVILPNARTVMATVFIFSCSWQWTNTSFAKLYYTKHQVMAMQPLLYWLRNNNMVDTMGTMISRNAACMLLLLPLITMFIACQRLITPNMITTGQAN